MTVANPEYTIKEQRQPYQKIAAVLLIYHPGIIEQAVEGRFF
jgi:hypothetical protein